MLIVKKFGGSSVANYTRIFNVAKRCIEDYKNGNDVVVVLSAMGDTTDDIIAKTEGLMAEAEKVTGKKRGEIPKPPKREMDMYLSIGEQESVALMSMAMNALGVPAVSLNALQVKMHTTSVHQDARLTGIDAERIHGELDQRKIVIITGFQGVDKNGDVTTLGRGGSDTTAVALAAALNADKCEIFTDVDGVYTADPRVCPKAHKLDEITYDEMLEMASLGAGVLHNRSVELAKKYGVTLVVRSSLDFNEGTIVKEIVKMEGTLISGVASDKNAARISVVGLEDQPGVAFKLFQHLANHHINVDIIIQSIGRDGTKDISFTVPEDKVDEAVKVIESHHTTSLKYKSIDVNTDVAKVSIVGAGMMTNPGVAAKMFEALYDAGININMICTSEIRVTVLIDEKYLQKATQAVHDKFF
ncbi:MAG TPA: aspartate kinase [Lachnospiraceae bacterium]|nr:aspartate kinase [Lachnospiraceae bacterium]HBZ89795.1 aspartate kinase [Lachnospiraceae bacterium]